MRTNQVDSKIEEVATGCSGDKRVEGSIVSDQFHCLSWRLHLEVMENLALQFSDMKDFNFSDIDTHSDGEIAVRVRETCPEDQLRGYAPVYKFDVLLADSGTVVGAVDLRISNTEHILLYAGHIGYGIDPRFRGNRYAAKACSLIKQTALAHGFKTLWITCNPDNPASRRTCEILGAQLVEIVDLPEYTEMYQKGERQKCRYRWDLDD